MATFEEGRRSREFAGEIRVAGRPRWSVDVALNATISINHPESGGVNVGWHFKSIARVRLKRGEGRARVPTVLRTATREGETSRQGATEGTTERGDRWF